MIGTLEQIIEIAIALGISEITVTMERVKKEELEDAFCEVIDGNGGYTTTMKPIEDVTTVAYMGVLINIKTKVDEEKI